MTGSLTTAVIEGDLDAVDRLLDTAPERAGERTPEGLSLVLAALYRGHRAVGERLAAGREGDLDIFDAAALEREERVTRLLSRDPGTLRSFACC